MPRGQKNATTTSTKIDINTIKKYLENGYLTNWGEGYIWNDEMVILRKYCSDDSWNFVIITKYNIINVEDAEKLTLN